MSTEVKEAVDTMQKAFEEFKSTNKEVIEASVKGYVDPLLTSKLDKLNEAITVAEEAKEAAETAQAMIKKRNEIEKDSDNMTSEQRELRAAFRDYLRKAQDADPKNMQIMTNHTKSLNTATDASGGYFVVPQFDSAITKILNETSPMRRVATIKQVSTDQYEKLQNTDLAGATWADRDVAPSESTTPTYKKLTIKAFKLEAEPQISQDMIDDSVIDIERELQDSLVEKFQITENTAFVLGDGVGQPRGLLTYAAGTSWGQIEQVVSGAAALPTYAGLVDLVYALKDGYLQRAAFMMKRSTVAAIRKLVDGNSQPLWMPGIGSEPATLMGYPIMRANDMPAVQAAALAIAFGDFARAYTIIDRIGTRVLRDPYTAKPFVKFYTTKRVGGAVDNYEAVKIQKIST